MSRRTIRHKCELQNLDESVLQKPPPYAPFYVKWFRASRRYVILSKRNPECSIYFRSQAACVKEKKRQVTNPKYRYIIHPLSRFCMIREKVMLIVWLLLFLVDPSVGSFLTDHLYDGENGLTDIFQGLLNVVQLADVFLNFFVGYCEIQTREIILEQRTIAKKYLLSYFIFDFASCFPQIFLVIAREFHLAHSLEYTFYNTHMLRFVRLRSMLKYVSNLLRIFKVSEAVDTCAVIFVTTFYILHWYGCILHTLPTFHTFLGLEPLKPPEQYWLFKDTEDGTLADAWGDYLDSLIYVTCHFFATGMAMRDSKSPTEQMYLSLVVMCGMVYYIHAIARILQVFGTVNISETKYEEILYQLSEYMVRKKLPPTLKRRLLMYYEYKFQKRFFMETAILSTLSEHLRYEILLYSCKNIIEHVQVFQGLSKAAIGTVISMLKNEVYLPQDTILRHDMYSDKVFFICHGTVAVYLTNGTEALHVEEGSQFGEGNSTLKKSGIKKFFNTIAVEITEVFTIKKTQLEYCLSENPEVTQKMNEKAREKFHIYLELQEKTTKGSDGKSNIMAELGKGKILERGRKREH